MGSYPEKDNGVNPELLELLTQILLASIEKKIDSP